MQEQEIVNRHALQELYTVDDAPVKCTGTLGVSISVYIQYVHAIRYSNAQTAHYGSSSSRRPQRYHVVHSGILMSAVSNT